MSIFKLQYFTFVRSHVIIRLKIETSSKNLIYRNLDYILISFLQVRNIIYQICAEQLTFSFVSLITRVNQPIMKLYSKNIICVQTSIFL